MNLGLFLTPGDSLTKQKKSGQLDRLINYYLKPYSKSFNKVYIFSYGDLSFQDKLPANIKLISKPLFIPYQLYQFLLPFIQCLLIREIDVFRVFQTIGGFPALMIEKLYKKPYLVTYGYHYSQFARIEKQPFKARLMTIGVKPVLKNAQKIITTSEDNFKYLDNL
ncbi:unnamed protein product, partial [marine sediment metagenome]